MFFFLSTFMSQNLKVKTQAAPFPRMMSHPGIACAQCPFMGVSYTQRQAKEGPEALADPQYLLPLVCAQGVPVGWPFLHP